MPPKVLSKGNDRAGGVLPVNAAARAAPHKLPTARLKLEIRRLPPSLTLNEFEETLGDEWKLGNGKVDWREYRQGKVKTSAGKIPEQSRCYVHLTSEARVKEFEARFLAVTFHDKAGTYKNPDIKHLPPNLGFAPNQRTSLNVKRRADNRQGTIDQDPEFISFLEAETLPIVKPAALDSVGAEKKEAEKSEVTSTPLIEALREKKANKAKAAAGKEEKKDGKGHTKSDSRDAAVDVDRSGKDGSAKQKKLDQPSKEPPNSAKKQSASKQQQTAAESPRQVQTKSTPAAKSKKVDQSPKSQNSATTSTSTTAATATATSMASQTPAPQRAPRQRGNTDGIKKMLQKDLGIRPKATTASSNETVQPPTSKASTSSTTKIANGPSQPPASTTITTTTTTTPATAPAKTQANSKAQSSNASTQQATKAYLKHTNPSQGMTEILIQQALAQYGEVTNVTIDPRKGTAIAIFNDHEGLKKAMEVKQIPVASGTVEVLEFRERNPGTPGGGRGGFRSGRGNTKGNKSSGPAAITTAVPSPAKTETA